MQRQPALLSQESRWKSRVGWLIRGRWLLATGMGLLGGTAAFAGASAAAARLVGVALAFGLVNLAVAAVDHHVKRRTARYRELSLATQLLLDVALLSWLAHLTGGLRSPFFLFLLAPALAATLTLRSSLASALLLVVLISPLAIHAGREAELLTAHPVPAGLPLANVAPWLTLAWTAAVFGFACLQVVHRLRDRERSLGDAQKVERSLRSQVDDLSQRSVIAELSTELAHTIREPLGIVRARAEALRLGVNGDSSKGAEVRHDLDVLLRNLESVQRGLRGILAFLPPSTVKGRIAVGTVAATEMRRLGLAERQFVVRGQLPELTGSHEEIQLAVGLVLRLLADQAGAGRRVRVRVLAVQSETPYAEFSLRAARPAESSNGRESSHLRRIHSAWRYCGGWWKSTGGPGHPALGSGGLLDDPLALGGSRASRAESVSCFSRLL